MSPEPTTAAPSLLATLDADTIKRTFREAHPKVPVDVLEVREHEGHTYVYVTDSALWVEALRVAQRQEAIGFRELVNDPTRPETADPDHPRRLRPVEVVTIPKAAAPAVPTATDAAARALVTLRRASDHLGEQMDALGQVMERPLRLGGDVLDDYWAVRGLPSAAQQVFDAAHDLERALTALQEPLGALRRTVAAPTTPTSPPDPLRRAVAVSGPSAAETLLDTIEDAQREAKGLLSVIRDSRARITTRLRATLDEDVPALEAAIEQREQAIRQQVAAIVDASAAAGRVTRSADRIMADAVGGFPALTSRRDDLMGLRRHLEALTRT